MSGATRSGEKRSRMFPALEKGRCRYWKAGCPGTGSPVVDSKYGEVVAHVLQERHVRIGGFGETPVPGAQNPKGAFRPSI